MGCDTHKSHCCWGGWRRCDCEPGRKASASWAAPRSCSPTGSGAGCGLTQEGAVSNSVIVNSSACCDTSLALSICPYFAGSVFLTWVWRCQCCGGDIWTLSCVAVHCSLKGLISLPACVKCLHWTSNQCIAHESERLLVGQHLSATQSAVSVTRCDSALPATLLSIKCVHAYWVPCDWHSSQCHTYKNDVRGKKTHQKKQSCIITNFRHGKQIFLSENHDAFTNS